MDYLPFPGYTDPDELEIPNSPLELQALALKKAISIENVNFKFLVKTSNMLYGETPLTEEIRGIFSINSAPNEEKNGKFIVKSSPLEFATTVFWEYVPDEHPDVLRLWITSLVKYNSSQKEQSLMFLESQTISQQKRELKTQFTWFKNWYVNKNWIFKEVLELINSDEFVNNCLTIATITLILSAILSPLLNFRDKSNQEQQQQQQQVIPFMDERHGIML